MPALRLAAAAAILSGSWLAAPLGAQVTSQDHPGQYTQLEIETGGRVYTQQCAHCHGPNGDQVSGIDLRRGLFRRAASDEDLAGIVTKGVPGTGMPPSALRPEELAGVVAYIRGGFDRTGGVQIGAASNGRVIVEGKGQCRDCHRIGGQGSRVGPDLSDIGLMRAASSLHRSLTDPSSGMMPINRPVRIVTRDGRTIEGRRLNEDTYTVQLIDRTGRLHSMEKSDIRSLVLDTQSPMPSYAGRLTAGEIADVIAYLLTLKEP